MEKEYKVAVIGQGYVGLPLALAFVRTKHNFSNHSILGDIGRLPRFTKKIAQLTKDIHRTRINCNTFDTRAQLPALGVLAYAYTVFKITELDHCL